MEENHFPEVPENISYSSFYKKGDETECKNYQGISPIVIAVKFFGFILLSLINGEGRK